MNRAMTFLKNLYQNNRFLWNGWPSNIRLLQSYEVLWTHVIDAICIKQILQLWLFGSIVKNQ